MTENINTQDNAGVTVPPPLLYAGPLVVGLILHRRFPVKFLPRRVALPLGGVCVALAVLLVRSAVPAMRRANTSLNPSSPVTALVTEGAFRLTRNPLYVALTLFYAGVALMVNALWAMLLLPFILIAVRIGVIEREERYLERKFGEQYLRYKARVRRWI